MKYLTLIIPVLALAGLVLIAYGTWLVYAPVGVIVAGVEAFAAACALAWTRGGSK